MNFLVTSKSRVESSSSSTGEAEAEFRPKLEGLLFLMPRLLYLVRRRGLLLNHEFLLKTCLEDLEECARVLEG